ncbi:MAG TPA: hypothetical protein VFP87_01315 [Chitinophagaceae bacterium]|nr:hypothetical protein [Chitinophagaceae bacterium]
MTKSIRSYKDLIEEKQRLEILVGEQRTLIRNDVQELKSQLQPLKDAVEFVKKITTKDKTSLLLTVGSDILINSVVKRLILARTGWFLRNVIPYFLRNYSSHFLGEHKDKWLEKLRSWLGHKNGKEQDKEKGKEKDRDQSSTGNK